MICFRKINLGMYKTEWKKVTTQESREQGGRQLGDRNLHYMHGDCSLKTLLSDPQCKDK